MSKTLYPLGRLKVASRDYLEIAFRRPSNYKQITVVSALSHKMCPTAPSYGILFKRIVNFEEYLI